MKDLIYFLAPMLVGVACSDLDRYYGTTAFFWVLMGAIVLSGAWIAIRS